MSENNKNEDVVQTGQPEEKIETKVEAEVGTKLEEQGKKIEVDDSKFIEKAEAQVIRILKDMDTLAFHGSKSNLGDKIIELILQEIREQTNVSKKQFSLNLNKNDFESLNVHVNKVLKEIKILGDLANKHSGEYEEYHVNHVFEAMKKKTNETKKKMKTKDKKDDKFSF